MLASDIVTRGRAVLLLWLLLMFWTSALYLRAALQPPPGRVFAGTFHWIDAFYNYASYVQQSEDGAFFSHPAAPDHRGRLAEARASYLGSPASARAGFLDRHRVTHLVLPGDMGPRPVAWLGTDTPFRAMAQVGQPPHPITIYARSGSPAALTRDERLR